MTILRRILAVLLCAALGAVPCFAAAEDAYRIPAGEVTKTAIADAYAGGMQIDVHARFGAQQTPDASARALAAQSLLEKTELTLSFYDDFGTARVRALLTLDGVTLFSADAQIYADGSAQAVTNLTGNSVLTLPMSGEMSAFADEIVKTVDIESEEFKQLPPFERLRIAWEDLQLLFIDHLLGWTSYVQRETGNLYAFDETDIEATDTRDAVDQRMIGTINSWDFCELFDNILMTIRDERPEFQQALADSLAQMGVTRYQVRKLVDSLLTQEEMDPAIDWVQPSASVLDDGALCTMDDVAYAIKKLTKSVDYILGDSGDNDLKLIVSYNADGGMVGFDLDMPIISLVTPYEGFFRYSKKTDEHEQAAHVAHGEFQAFDGYRLVGDLSANEGRDVDGVNADSLTGYLDLQSAQENSVTGVGIDTGITYRTDGVDSAEAFEGRAQVSLRTGALDGETQSTPLADVNVAGETAVDESGFSLAARAEAALLGHPISAEVTMQAVEFDGEAFPTGETLDLTAPGARESVRQTVVAQASALLLSLAGNDALMQDVMALLP